MTRQELPHAADAELWLIGSVFSDPRIMARHARELEPGDFYLEKHRLVWQAFQSLQRDGRDIDILSVAAELEKGGFYNSVFGGKKDDLFDMQESTPSSACSESHADMIAKASALRKLISAAQKIIAEASSPAADADRLLAESIDRVSEIASARCRSEGLHLADSALRFLNGAKEIMAKGKSAGISTGFAELDRITGGLRPGELTIAGAKTGMGKTSFALSAAMHAAKTVPVKFFSLEVSEKQLAPRTLSFLNKINMQRILNANLSEEELGRNFQTVEELRGFNFHVELKIRSIEKIIAESHAFAAKRGAGLIVIDHLHFIKSKERAENENVELGKITRALKDLSKDLDVPVLLLSQLNRDNEKTPNRNRKPRLSDLRGSGNIEQDADMVWFLHREGYYDPSLDPSDTDIIVAKNRSGPKGEAKLHFDTNTTRFSDPPPKAQTVSYANYYGR
jgi:replicative DNA helicase